MRLRWGLGRAGALGEEILQVQEKKFPIKVQFKERARDPDSAHIEAENHRVAEQETTKSRGVP